MKKVLIIITTAFVPYGGLTSVMMNYYRALDKTSLHIDFASTTKPIDRSLCEELSANNSKYYYLGNRKKHPLVYIKNLNRLLKEEKYDIVHVNSNSATAAIELNLSKINGVKNRIVHNHTSICDHIFLHKIMTPFFKNSFTQAIACSEKAGLWIFGKNKYTVINNGINSEKYRFCNNDRMEIRKKYRIDENMLVLGHLGKIYEPKNHHFLIRVFEKYRSGNPNSCLLLVGDGVMRAEIEAEVKQRGLEQHVIFAGMQKETEKYLSAMDMFLFPSLWEGMPLSLIEAQASGLHCFASSRIDSAVCITDTVELLDIDHGEDNWVKAIERYAQKSREDTSERCIKIIKRKGYDVFKNAEVLEAIYQI